MMHALFTRYRSPNRNLTKERGVVQIELAFVLPVLLLLAFATVELALALSSYKLVVGQVRGAARYLSTQAPGVGHADAICLVKTGILQPACTGSFLAPGFANATVTIQDSRNAADHRAVPTTTGAPAVIVNLVTVTVSGYQHQFIAGSLISAVVGNAQSITFDPIRLTMRQVSG
jgi:Flp pilus assembly protein TadG